MTRLAILDRVLPAQLRERPDDLGPVEVVWMGTDPERLLAEAASKRPTVLALDLNLLGGEEVAVAATRRMVDATGAELAILLYQFARRDVLRDAARTGLRPVRAPISLASLRTHMTSVIVRHVLRGGATLPLPSAPAAKPARDEAETGRLFSREQLGRLREIQSSIDCECPNHLSELLLALEAFEDYSAACKNRDEADAAMHASLYDSTVSARRVMEEALAALLRHEKIVL